MNKKLKAFTLMELIVGLIISSVVIAMAATGFRIVQMQFVEYKKANTKVLQLSTLEFLLCKDAEECSRLEKLDDNSFAARFASKEIIYKVADASILRTQGYLTDTFNIGLRKMEISFSNKPVLAEKGLIDMVGLKMGTVEGPQSCYITKLYSAKTLTEDAALTTLYSY
jgi:prepilin-type N-terminal cleavage/methylation domain-containing protein